jgi:hypothetical protein
MSRQLILHIGYPKTGTTALQSFWHLNAAFLRDNALLYPQAGRVHTAHYGYSYRLGLHDGDTRFDVSELDEMISCLRAEMDQNGVNRALLSSEVFIKAADPETVRTVFEGFDVKILVYLRRHDHLLESGYSQSVRSSPSPPWDSSIGSFILHQLGAGQFSYDYLALLRRWSEVFGKSNMMIRALRRFAPCSRYRVARRAAYARAAQQRPVLCGALRHRRRSPSRRAASLQARNRGPADRRRPRWGHWEPPCLALS